ncbi:MAG: DUF418 domain-containing protein [Sphingomonas sp.]
MTDLPTADAAQPISTGLHDGRIAQLDVVRGVAVMGILAMNIVAFTMPFQAYLNPTSYGLDGPADLASWAFNYVFVDGKMRGLFSFLFGASTLLVIERAEAGGQSAVWTHYARMFWLLIFGLAHFYLIWFGDILAAYALVGLVLFLFRSAPVRVLTAWGVVLIGVQCLLMLGFGFRAFELAAAVAAPNPDPALVEEWRGITEIFGRATPQQISADIVLHGGPWTGQVQNRIVEHGAEPFTGIFFFGWETLAYMLFGMAALKSGFFRGEWPAGRYRRIVLIGLAISVPAYGAFAWLLVRDGFTAQMVVAMFAATTPFRPVMIFAYAALIVLLARGGGALAGRIAAAGRAAFTNYLGTSILMTALFYGYGFGLYGTMSRIELWLPVLAVWALMLIWSKPWLERYHYGPLEWLWRSLARMEWQPMRRSPPSPTSP